MTAITGSDTFTATCVGPDPGTATHTQVNDLGEHLANRTIWLKNRLVGCGDILEHGLIGSSSLLASLIDLKTQTTYTTIPGMTYTLAEAADVGDIILVEASCQVLYQGDTLGTDYLKIGIRAPNGGSSTLQGATVRVFSDESTTPHIAPCTLAAALKVTGSDGGTLVDIQGACATSGGNTFASVYGPWTLSVMHIRPVAAP